LPGHDEQKHYFRLIQLGQLTRANAAAVMCWKCRELDLKIVRYREILSRVLDAQLVAGVTELIKEAEAEKAALQPDHKAAK
jgi:hypothetical protein